MASSLGSLYIELKARTADFVAGMTQAQALSQRQMRQIQRNANDMQRSLETGFQRMAVVASAAAAGLAVALGRTADSMYQTVIAARQSGAAVDVFSQLVEVADDAGVGLQAVQTGMQTLARNAASTSPQIQDYFKQLHIDPRAADSPVTLLMETLQAIQRIHDPLQRQQAELLLLGRSGAQLEPLVREANNLSQAMQAQADSGVAMSQKQAAAAVAWHGTVDTLQDDFRAVVQVLVTSFQPTFSRLVGNLSEWIQALRQSEGLQTFINVIKAIADNLKLIAIAAGTTVLVTWVARVVAAFATLKQAMITLTTLRILLAGLSGPVGWLGLAAGAAAAGGAYLVFKHNQDIAASGMTGMTGAVQGQSKALQDLQSQLAGVAALSPAAAKAALIPAGAQFNGLLNQRASLNASIDNLTSLADPNNLGKNGVFATDPQRAAFKAQADRQRAQLADVNKQLDASRQYMQSLASQSQGGLTFRPTAPTARGTRAAAPNNALATAVSALQAASLQTGNDAVDQRAESIRKLTDAYDKYVSSGGNVAKADAQLADGLRAVNLTYAQAVSVQKDQAAQYMQSLQQQIAVQKQGYDQQIAAISQGPQEAQFQQQRIALVQQYTDRITELRGQMAILADQGKSTANVQAEITAQTAAQGDAVKVLLDYQARLVATQGSFGAGFRGTLGQLRDSAINVAGQVNSAFANLFDGLGDAVANFVTTGKLNFSDLVNSFFADMVRMEMRVLESQLLMSIFGAPTIGAQTISPLPMNVPNVVGIGGMRAGGGPVLSGTTYLVGERGPELFTPNVSGAITPNGAAPPVQVAINITNKGQPVQATQTGQRMDGRQMIIDIALDAFNNDVASGGRSAKTIQQRFGLARRGIPVSG